MKIYDVQIFINKIPDEQTIVYPKFAIQFNTLFVHSSLTIDEVMAFRARLNLFKNNMINAGYMFNEKIIVYNGMTQHIYKK